MDSRKAFAAQLAVDGIGVMEIATPMTATTATATTETRIMAAAGMTGASEIAKPITSAFRTELPLLARTCANANPTILSRAADITIAITATAADTGIGMRIEPPTPTDTGPDIRVS